MLLFIGYIAASPREAIRPSADWGDRLAPYLADPVVAEADGSTIASVGKSVSEMLFGGFGRVEQPIQIYLFQYALYTMIARALLIKDERVTSIVGYSGGIQPGLLAAGVFRADDFPHDIAEMNRGTYEAAIRNRQEGIAACAVDFQDAALEESDVFALIESKFGGRIYLQDRRAYKVMDFVGPRPLMEDFLATLDRRASMAVRASRLRPDGGYHTSLSGCYDGLPDEKGAWPRIRDRLAQCRYRFASTVGHWWPAADGTATLRDITMRTHTEPIQSGRLANLVSNEQPVFLCSKLVLQETFAGTGYRPSLAHLVHPSMI